jgi:hypothetical protein
MNVEFNLGNACNIVTLEVKNPLRTLNHGAGITRDEEFDRLRKTILGHEHPRLGSEQLLTLGGGRRPKKIGIGNGDGRGTGVMLWLANSLAPSGSALWNSTLTKSTLSFFSVFTPMRRGEPLLALTTHDELDQRESGI